MDMPLDACIFEDMNEFVERGGRAPTPTSMELAWAVGSSDPFHAPRQERDSSKALGQFMSDVDVGARIAFKDLASGPRAGPNFWLAHERND